MKSYHIVIVGGGLVGLSALLALNRLCPHLKIALIDAQGPQIASVPSAQDMRSIVLSHASQRIFTQWGCWEELKPLASAITAVHISQSGCLGRVKLTAQEQEVPALGYVIPADKLSETLKAYVSSLEYFHHTTCTGIQWQGNQIELKIQNKKEERWLTHLVLAADGANSTIRTLAQIPVKQFSYPQQAVVTSVKVKHPNHTGYERFIGKEALALVPRLDNIYGVIWKVSDDRAHELLNLSAEEFLKHLQAHLGYRLGKLSDLGPRKAYPLKFMRALKETLPNLALLGDAAHANPPIAAQGFNLSLRDIAVLADRIGEAVRTEKSFYDAEFLQQYEDMRLADQAKIISLVNFPLTSIFELIPSSWKGLTWLGMDVCKKVRNSFAHTMMGLAA